MAMLQTPRVVSLETLVALLAPEVSTSAMSTPPKEVGMSLGQATLLEK